MRLIDLDQAKVGMKLARSIYRYNGDMMLRDGTLLTPQFIARLKNLGYYSLYVEDGLIDDIEIEEIISEKTRVQAVKCIHEVMKAIHNGQNLHIESVQNVVSNIIEELMHSNDIMLNLSDIWSFDEYTFEHSINVTVLSVIIGMCLFYPKDKLMDLGTGVLLHDVGKTLIPPEILNKSGRLTPGEYETIKQHTWLGFESLRANPHIRICLAHVALQHHERYDGSGYPRGLKGTRILESARICAIADVFDAMTHDRCYRKKHPVHKVYAYLLENAGSYDPAIMDSFIQKVALYPKGAKVMLDDGRSGYVIRQNFMEPFRPILRLFWTNGLELPKPIELDLLMETGLNIVDTIDD